MSEWLCFLLNQEERLNFYHFGGCVDSTQGYQHGRQTFPRHIYQSCEIWREEFQWFARKSKVTPRWRWERALWTGSETINRPTVGVLKCISNFLSYFVTDVIKLSMLVLKLINVTLVKGSLVSWLIITPVNTRLRGDHCCVGRLLSKNIFRRDIIVCSRSVFHFAICSV